MENRLKCQNNNCLLNANLFAWGKWVCRKCHLNKINELNNNIWKDGN